MEVAELWIDQLQFWQEAVPFVANRSREQTILLMKVRIVIGVVDISHDSLPQRVENINGSRDYLAWPDVANGFSKDRASTELP